MKNLLGIWTTSAIIVLYGFKAPQAFAWRASYVADAPIRWHSDANTVGFKFQQSSIPAGSALRTGIMQAIDLMNSNPSLIRAKINPDTDWVSVGNGQNEVWFTDNSLVHQGAPALCIWHFNPFAFGIWNRTESDVIFNPSEQYTAGRTLFDSAAYNGAFRPIQTTALHEFGHALGMEHENRLYNIMGTDWDHVNLTGSVVTASRGPDIGEGLIQLYGPNSAAETIDLSVSNFKYMGTSGEYSTHQRTAITAAVSGETVTPFFASEDDPLDPNQLMFDVQPGQMITAEFTFENNGLNPRTGVRTRYVLSSNRTITTLDRTLQEVSYTYPRNRPVTRSTVLRLPSDLRSGERWYLGVIVDSTNAVPEPNKRNNATYIPIDIP